MTLTETLLVVNKGSPYYNILDELCFLSKNLYNASLYEIRKHYNDTKTFLSAFSLIIKYFFFTIHCNFYTKFFMIHLICNISVISFYNPFHTF